ncbi:MAG TPA: TonB-dependent receptor plug domain-containing protein, partial [Brevundimonas sp.]|nr:TonB-dependent receptor plug domain-containing protein [Brevundimonas sp.]
MKSVKLLFMIGTALSTPAGAALAQTPATPAPAQASPPARPAPATQTPPAAGEPARVGDVVVSGRASDVRASIDSTSYSLANDLQAASGSLADALRNVPSVDVDPQGNVTLRGDGNVTILVDGRPSGVLSGEGRAQALLQLPADQYARIEVMTNPSAAYSPEGTGGVINLITKPTTVRAGSVTTGSIRANVGDHGRWNLGASGSWARDRLTLSGDIGARHDKALQEAERLREQLNPVTGAVVRTTRQTQDIDGDSDVQFARLGAEYRLSDRLLLTGELRGNNIDNGGTGLETYEVDTGAGVPISRYVRDGAFSFQGNSAGATGRVLRTFGEGHDWTTELRLDRNRGEFSLDAEYISTLPPGPSTFEN